MHFNAFIASSARIHKIMERADEVNKFIDWNCVILLAML